MLARVLIGITLAVGLLPLAALAQEEENNEVVVEESEPVDREQALNSLDTAIEHGSRKVWRPLRRQ